MCIQLLIRSLITLIDYLIVICGLRAESMVTMVRNGSALG